MGLIKVTEVVLTFLVGEYTMVMFAIWLSLVSLLLHFPQEPYLTTELSSGNVGMQKQTFCSSPVALHLLQNCLDLAFMQCIGEVGDTAWRQTDLLMGFLRAWLFSKNSDKVSNRMSLLHTWISSLL